MERYAYTAYGTPTITDASGTTRTTTAIGNRYTYTGRECDETLSLYHYRARMYDSLGGRFVSRDPIGYEDGLGLFSNYFGTDGIDPSGMRRDTVRERLYIMCHSCADHGKEEDCKGKADAVVDSIKRTWNTNHGNGTNTSVDNVGGYLCWDWADMYDRVCKKHGGSHFCSERRRIRNKTTIGDPEGTQIHFYTRFCVGGCSDTNKSKEECCVDIDDGWFAPDHDQILWEPDEMIEYPDWEDDPDQSIPGKHQCMPIF